MAWEELYNKYGPLVGLRLGKDRIILVSGQSNVKKVLLNEDFDARPDGFFFRMRSYKQRLGKTYIVLLTKRNILLSLSLSFQVSFSSKVYTFKNRKNFA